MGLWISSINISLLLHNSQSLRNALAAFSVQGYMFPNAKHDWQRNVRELLNEIPTQSVHIWNANILQMQSPIICRHPCRFKIHNLLLLCKTKLTSIQLPLLQPCVTHTSRECRYNVNTAGLALLRWHGFLEPPRYFSLPACEIEDGICKMEWDYDALILFQMLIYGFHKIYFALELRKCFCSVAQWLNFHGSAIPRKLSCY